MRATLERPRRGARNAAEPNMTPMIDVVFLLIIFFLVSSHLARRETRLQLDLPVAATGRVDTDPAPRLTINLAADGQLTLASEPIAIGKLTPRLLRAAEASTAPLRIRLRGDQAVEYARVEPVLAACVAAGVEDVSLAVLNTPASQGANR